MSWHKILMQFAVRNNNTCSCSERSMNAGYTLKKCSRLAYFSTASELKLIIIRKRVVIRALVELSFACVLNKWRFSRVVLRIPRNTLSSLALSASSFLYSSVTYRPCLTRKCFSLSESWSFRGISFSGVQTSQTSIKQKKNS